jgi:DNA polymerase (family 10)
MDASNIARVLREMAILLEIKGANPFEIMAYRNGADHIEEWSGDLVAGARDGTLTEIPGIGKGLAHVIGDLVRTGRSDEHRQLREEFPPGLPDVILVPGLGPKRVRTLYEELAIGSLEDLEAAAKAGRIRTLRGFGKKTEEGILTGGIDVARRRVARRDGAGPDRDELIS